MGVRFFNLSSFRLINRLAPKQTLSELDRARFYSNWYYVAICLLVEIHGFSNRDALANKLTLPLGLVNEAVNFLMTSGILVENLGSLSVGVNRTHLDQSSLLVTRHHINWRLKSIEKFDHLNHQRDLLFTGPMTLSEEDAMKIRKILLDSIERVMNVTQDSPSEGLHCLNIDWVKF